MITSISASPLNLPFVESDFMQTYSEAESNSELSSKKFLFAFDSFARFRHQFRPRFSFSEARVAGGKTRLPQLLHALQQSFHHWLPAPEEHRPDRQRNSRHGEQQFNWRQACEPLKIKWRHRLHSIGPLSRNEFCSIRGAHPPRVPCRAPRPALRSARISRPFTDRRGRRSEHARARVLPKRTESIRSG